MVKYMSLLRLLIIGLLAGAVALPPSLSAASAESYSQNQKIKKKHRPVAQRRVKTNFRGTRADEPIAAGMDDFCGYWYAVNNRMPAGCDRNGRSFYIFDH